MVLFQNDSNNKSSRLASWYSSFEHSIGHHPCCAEVRNVIVGYDIGQRLKARPHLPLVASHIVYKDHFKTLSAMKKLSKVASSLILLSILLTTGTTSAQVQLIFTDCGKMDLDIGEMIISQADPLVQAEFGIGNNSDDGYQFWFEHPGSGYNRLAFISHANPIPGSPPGPTAAQHIRPTNLVTSPIPLDVVLNVRVRPRLNGVDGAFGPVCQIMYVSTPNLCPTTKLIDDPNHQFYSCGATDLVIGGSDKIWSWPVAGADLCQFEFRQPIVPLGPDWFLNFPAGVDSMGSEGIIGFNIGPVLDCTFPAANRLSVQGPVVVDRGAAQDIALPTAPCPAVLNGLNDVIPTEIVNMHLTGGNACGGFELRVGAGAGIGPGAPLPASTGHIVGQIPGDNTIACSYFEVWFELEIPFPPFYLYNQAPLVIIDTIDGVPPLARYVHSFPPGLCVGMYTDPVPGQGALVASLVDALHDTGTGRRIAHNDDALVLGPWVDKPLQPCTTYEVRVRASFDNGCSFCPWGEVCTITTECPPPATESLKSGAEAAIEFNIWPNPNDGEQLHMSITTDGPLTVDLFDMSGKQVMSTTFNIEGAQPDLSIALPGDLEAGVYLLRARSDEALHTERLIIR